MLATFSILVAILLALWMTWRYVPPGTRSGNGQVMVGFVAFSVLAMYSFFLLYRAGIEGYFECSSTRCGSSDAHLSVEPIRYWMLYAMYWTLGFLSVFVSMGAAVQLWAVKRD